MFSQLLDGNHVNLFIALLAGFVTFFASCLLPLVPTYLAYLSGIALNNETVKNQRWHIVRMAMLFVLGFIGTFIVLGLSLHQLSSVIGQYRKVLNQLAGLFFVLMGFFMLGIFKHRLFSQERKVDIDGFFENNRSIHAILTGIAFGFGWTPCIGPILAVILFWSAQAETLIKGFSLLLAYGIGLGIPFILVALAFERIVPLLKKYSKVSHIVNLVAGGIIILAGLLMISGRFQDLSLFILHLFNLESLSA